MELEGGRATLEEEEEEEEGTKSDLETAEPPSCPETAGTRAKDQCDCLLDSIDAQLSQLLGPGAGVAGGHTNGDTSLECSPKASWTAEMEGCCANQDSTSWGEASPSRKEEYGWRLIHLLGSEQAPETLGDQSDSNSICTEDFAARFREGMVDPLVNSDEEGDVPAGGFPAGDPAEEGHVTGIKARPAGLWSTMEACGAAAEGFVLSTARRQHILQRSEEGLEENSALALSSSMEGAQSLSSRTRRESLESLGGRISRLSRSNTMDTPSSTDMGKASVTGSRAPGLALPERVETSEESVPWPLEGSSRWGQNSRENSLPFSSPLLVEELGPSQPLRALGADAGTRAWARESQPVRTAPNPSGRRQTAYGHVWSDSPSHFASTAAHGSPSLASKGQKSPQLIASPCPDQRLPPEKLRDQSSALQEFSATTQLASSLESAQTPPAVVSDGCVVTQGGVGPGDPEREAPELLQQGSVIPQRPSGRGITHAAVSGGGEGTWRSWELQAGPAERGARGLTLCPDPEAGISEKRERQSSLSPAWDEVYPGPCKYKHVAGVPVTSFDTVTIDSDLYSVRTETVQVHLCKAIGRWRAPGCSTKGPRCPRRDSLGCLGSSSEVTDEEEEAEEEFLWSRGSADWRSSSPARWSSMPRRTESSWEGTRKEACTEHQDLGTEEERLLQRKSQLHEADLSLTDILGQKKRAVQDLDLLRGALERSQKEAETLDSCLKETRSKADEARADLLLLQYRRDSCLRELPELEKELSVLRQQRSTMHSTQLGPFQAEVSSLVAEREELKARVHHLEGSLFFLECQLSCCKAELFSEQQAARARIEELQECLEEAQNKLEERMAEGTELQEETTRLRLQLRELERVREAQVQKQAAALSGQIRDLRVQETEQELRLSALKKILSEKELELVRLQEVICVLTAEKEAQQRAMENLREEHDRQLGKMQQEKELEWAQQREALQCLKQQELQEFAESLEDVKARALQDQAASFQKEVENLARVIEARDEEIRRQRETMQQQKESTQQLVRELKQEAKEMVQSALLQEQRKWEAEKREALQVQCRTLEEQSQRAHVEALDKEKRTVSVLQNKTLEYQQRIQELELHSRSLQQEKQEALEELRTLLQEEKTEALRRLRKELEQERARESDQLRVRLQQLEEEQSHLRAEQNEMSSREREAQSQAQRAERSLAREIGLACQCLQDLLPERGRGLMAHGSLSPLSASHSLQLLHAVTEETQRYLGALQQELEAQNRTMLHFQEEKEGELRQQREQLHLESKEALEALKEQLIQEHLQEIASLQRTQLKEAGDGEQQMLRQQLREKDRELQAIQRSMAHWKDQTTCKLARKFEELNAALETRFSWDRPRGLRRRVERLDAEIGWLSTVKEKHSPLAKDRSEHTHLCPTASSSSAPLGQHGFVSSKLLRQLQGRVRELRAENALFRGSSLEDLAALRAEPGQTGREKRRLTAACSVPQFHGASCRK